MGYKSNSQLLPHWGIITTYMYMYIYCIFKLSHVFVRSTNHTCIFVNPPVSLWLESQLYIIYYSILSWMFCFDVTFNTFSEIKSKCYRKRYRGLNNNVWTGHFWRVAHCAAWQNSLLIILFIKKKNGLEFLGIVWQRVVEHNKVVQ